MLERPRLQIAAIFHLTYWIAILVLAAMLAAREGSLGLAFVLGAVLGFAAYRTYDITNLSTLKDWPVKMSVVDMVWGAFLTAISTTAGALTLSSPSFNAQLACASADGRRWSGLALRN